MMCSYLAVLVAIWLRLAQKRLDLVQALLHQIIQLLQHQLLLLLLLLLLQLLVQVCPVLYSCLQGAQHANTAQKCHIFSLIWSCFKGHLPSSSHVRSRCSNSHASICYHRRVRTNQKQNTHLQQKLCKAQRCCNGQRRRAKSGGVRQRCCRCSRRRSISGRDRHAVTNRSLRINAPQRLVTEKSLVEVEMRADRF
jgi:hypothetical protein